MSRVAWIALALAAVLSTAAGCEDGLALLLDVDRTTPAALHGALGGEDAPLVVDVRGAEAFATGHVPGAVHVPYGEAAARLRALAAAQERPRALVTVCERGRLSLGVASLARDAGFPAAASLSGGITAWRAAGLPLATGAADVPTPAAAPDPPLSTFEQGVAVAAGLVIKPTYMLLTALLLLALWRARGRDLVLLRRGLLLFLVGEVFCAANFLATAGAGFALDALHGLGMVAMGAYLPWAAFALLDERVLRLSDIEKRCAFLRFCGRCHKDSAAVGCGVHRLFLLLAPASALLALLPWSAPLHAQDRLVDVFGTPVHYAYSLGLQLLDFRLLPALAAVAFLVAFARLLRGPAAVRRAQAPFFVGLGALGYALLRFFLLEAFRAAPVWADFWEELTELLTIVTVAVALVIFRRPLAILPWWKRGQVEKGSDPPT